MTCKVSLVGMTPLSDPYRYLWREEITEWGHAPNTPNHIYITKGTDLIGYVKRGTTDVTVFNTVKRTWSPSRRKFKKLGKKEIDALCMNTELRFAA